MNRRDFGKKVSLVAGGALTGFPNIASTARSYSNIIGANDKIRIGVIGCNGMGWADANALLQDQNVEVTAICDVDQAAIDKRIKDYANLRKNKVSTFTDYRKLLDDEEMQAIVIGTPDHWHCKMMVDAVESGKHVYVEKPIANTIEECQIMVDAAKKSGKCVQVGQWQRSGDHYKKALDLLWSGKLGQIRLVKVWAYQGWMNPIPVLPDAEPPKGVDYNMWLGPAPKRPFNPNRFHFNFRWFWDYAGGLMTDWGVHEIDIALYGMKATAPKSVMASGGKLAYPDDASETPDTLQALFEYENFNMLWEHATGIDHGPYGRREGIAFIGNNGTLVVNRQGYEVLVERESRGYSERGKGKMEEVESYQRPASVNYLAVHCQNFLDAMRNDDPARLNTPIDSGSIAAINAQMGNIAYKTGRKVFWNQNENKFDNDDEASKLVFANYHNGWKLPGKS